MLVVMVIIGLLASLGMAALFSAQESARAAHTKALVAKLHNQMMLRWETYRTRRLPVTTDVPANALPTANLQPYALQQLEARRELMRMELPDSYMDLFFVPVRLVDQSNNPFTPALRSAYQRRVWALDATASLTSIANGTPTGKELWAGNESAECLYMIMTTGMGDESSVDVVFSPRDVGDTDKDGMPEFIDGWGQPIRWIRWPAGFVSDLQPLDYTNPSFPAGVRNPTKNHDPFDPLGVEKWNGATPPPYGYALYPLIMSAGRDGELGIFLGLDYASSLTSDPYAAIQDTSNPPLVPMPGYAFAALAPSFQRGAPIVGQFGGDSGDNIHNHMIDVRK